MCVRVRVTPDYYLIFLKPVILSYVKKKPILIYRTFYQMEESQQSVLLSTSTAFSVLRTGVFTLFICVYVCVCLCAFICCKVVSAGLLLSYCNNK